MLRAFWFDLLLAFRNVVRQRRRSAIAIGAIAFGITALILASGFIEWIFQDFRESTIKSQLGHLQIVRPGFHDGGKADPYAFLLPDLIPELEGLNETPRIKTIAPRISFSGLISHGESTLSFVGDGVNPKLEEAFGNSLVISVGQNLAAHDKNAIIVGEGLARNLGVGVGDSVVLLATTASGSTNAVEVTVRGLFSTVTKAYDDSAIRIPLSTAQALLRTKGSHVWVVLLNETADTDTMFGRLGSQLGAEKFEVVPWYKLADFYNKTTALFTKQIQGIRTIIAFIILLSISNTMTMNVMERVGEIGTSMALGVKRRHILRLFLSEGALLGCFGAILGLLVGLLLADVLSRIGIPMPPPPGMARGYTGQILVTWNIALESFALAVGTTLIASILPAWHASRMVIVDALRRNR